jgi:hypothetical protein
MEELIFIVEDAAERGYLARALGVSIATQADDLDALEDAARDALLCHFDDAERPNVNRLHYVEDRLIAV